MTDPELVHRAEQAYLGALLARHGRAGTGTVVAGDAGPGALAGLRPQDFADPVHQAVYAALASQALPAPAGPAAFFERLRAMLARLLSARARDAAAYMDRLPGQCPDPANMPAYAAMVTEASHARAVPGPVPAGLPARVPQSGTESPRLASAAQWLDSTRAGRHQASARQAGPAYAGQPPQPRRTPDSLDRQTARLARALGADVRRLAGRAAPSAARGPAPAAIQATPLTADARQQQLLAALMLHSADRDVISWLPATAFTAGHNRTLYQLIRRRLDDGRPVDPLIIAWDASALIGASGPAASRGESLPATALRLGTLNPDPGSAATLALSLHTAHLHAGATGSDRRREPETVPVPAMAGTAADPARTAAPGQAGQKPAATAPHPAAAAPAPPVVSRAEPAPAPAAAGRPVPASPRHASGLPLRRPPLPGPAESGPVPQA